ncbi:DUF192 domain-containing protein [Cognatishimia sp. 1_MG-2023]|uniref:DUF192 domain-containing protein n=1 Tax=Cognatishimia sp. 1_MG-2023 TaxID=3062642 RepID=UPI0026E155C3|nr:DUF192 domain-containing protein [Cognatishimia sp. 1_MG-2023]MDO6727325.1 DUF192 domain-containing protein [Cognatishimia sp. 1_MG-2023]
MTFKRRILANLAGAALSVLCASIASADCRRDTVHLRGDWGQARFTVEVADNAVSRSKGLMGRSHMPSSSGMLFVYHRTDDLAFWMKNTLIPLDIIFLDEMGVVVNIHHSARPQDLTPLPSTAPSRYVLEINGGLAKALGIEKGTQLKHPAVLQPNAAWACREAG